MLVKTQNNFNFYSAELKKKKMEEKILLMSSPPPLPIIYGGGLQGSKLDGASMPDKIIILWSDICPNSMAFYRTNLMSGHCTARPDGPLYI